jgi:hypothetical protein
LGIFLHRIENYYDFGASHFDLRFSAQYICPNKKSRMAEYPTVFYDGKKDGLFPNIEFMYF